MNDIVGRIFMLILTVFAMFFVPVLTWTNSQDDLVQGVVYTNTHELSSAVCEQGVLTANQYQMFLNELDSTNLLYDVDVEIGHSTVVPVYDTAGAVTGTKTVDSIDYTDDVLSILFEGTGEYHLSRGDSISITVKSKELTLGQKARNAILHTSDYSSRIYAQCGGTVRDEKL